jgi:hypothetical protein
MKRNEKATKEIPVLQPSFTQQLAKRKVVPERKKIRQLLRSMLSMEDDERELQEEQKFHMTAKAH